MCVCVGMCVCVLFSCNNVVCIVVGSALHIFTQRQVHVSGLFLSILVSSFFSVFIIYFMKN